MAGVRRALRLADIAMDGLPIEHVPPRERLRRFARALPILVVYAALLLGGQRYLDWRQEAYGDAKLAHPSSAECGIARALLSDHRRGDAAAIMRRPLPKDHQVRLNTWAMSEARIGIRRDVGAGLSATADADWRWCPGLGSYARDLDYQRLGQFSFGPGFRIQRPWLNAAGDVAVVSEEFEPPVDDYGSGAEAAEMRSWTTTLVLDRPSGRWTIARRQRD